MFATFMTHLNVHVMMCNGKPVTLGMHGYKRNKIEEEQGLTLACKIPSEGTNNFSTN